MCAFGPPATMPTQFWHKVACVNFQLRYEGGRPKQKTFAQCPKEK